MPFFISEYHEFIKYLICFLTIFQEPAKIWGSNPDPLAPESSALTKSPPSYPPHPPRKSGEGLINLVHIVARLKYGTWLKLKLGGTGDYRGKHSNRVITAHIHPSGRHDHSQSIFCYTLVNTIFL